MPASAGIDAERQRVVSAVTPEAIGERLASYADALRATAIRAWREAREVDFAIRTSATGQPDRSSAAERPARAGDVFGSVAIGFRRLPALEKLEPSYRQMNGALLSGCADGGCPQPQARLAEAIDGLRTEGFARKVRSVNVLVNRYVAYRRDIDNYGVIDHWATPREMLERRSGDCEDYAILKMALLRELGVPASSMSVVILGDESRGLFHAVLSLRTNRGHLILDNVRDDVLMDRDLPHYRPLYSVSDGRGYIHGRRSNGERTLVGAMPLASVAPGEGPSPGDAAGDPAMRSSFGGDWTPLPRP